MLITNRLEGCQRDTLTINEQAVHIKDRCDNFHGLNGNVVP